MLALGVVRSRGAYMRGLWERYRALSVPVKIVLALVALGLSILLRPLMVVLAALALIVCLLVMLRARRAWPGAPRQRGGTER